jgi:hypothetical protein
MHVPTISPVTAVVNLTGVDAGLHDMVGVSWHILMPYTFLGGALMLYSQSRLLRGQREMAKEARLAENQPTPKNSRRWKQLLRKQIGRRKRSLEPSLEPSL